MNIKDVTYCKFNVKDTTYEMTLRIPLVAEIEASDLRFRVGLRLLRFVAGWMGFTMSITLDRGMP